MISLSNAYVSVFISGSSSQTFYIYPMRLKLKMLSCAFRQTFHSLFLRQTIRESTVSFTPDNTYHTLNFISKTKLKVRLSWCHAAYHMKHLILYADSQVVFAVEREIFWTLTLMCQVILRGCSLSAAIAVSCDGLPFDFFLFKIVIGTQFSRVFPPWAQVVALKLT